MITESTIREIALAYEQATEEPHFEKTSFRIKKKIFLTLDLVKSRACVKLSLNDQSVFSSFNKEIIYPIPNKWGLQGWTLIELSTVREPMLRDMINCSFCEVAPATIATKYKVL